MATVDAVGSGVPRLKRTARCAALLALLLSACDGLDVTQATGIPELPDDAESAGEAPAVLPPSEAAATHAAASSFDAGTPPTEVAETTPANVDATPVIPTPRPRPTSDAGSPSEPEVTLDCSGAPAAPVAFDVLQGFSSSEDFAFDELGNYVGVDADNNLIRISISGEKQLWAPAIGSTAGMGILPDGSLVFCEVGEGALKRVYPNGAVTVVLGGLLYPNGLDVGPDGFVYVAENGAGRVRRVDPDTGEFSIVAMGLTGPNGVAFSDDPALLYIGSFEGSGIYKVELPDPEQLGHASVFARPNGSALPEPALACPDQQQGLDCTSTYILAGKCQALANVVDCMPVDPCPSQADDSYCDYPISGVCRAGRCIELGNVCAGRAEGAACQDPFVGPGVCTAYDTELYCTPPNPCTGLRAGEVCEDPYSGAGVCEAYDDELYCTQPNPCAGLSAGAVCEAPSIGAGVCEAYDTELYCTPPNPCAGLSADAVCEDPSFGTGSCIAYDTELYCTPPNPCAGLSADAVCEDPSFGTGSCVAYDTELYCTPPGPCTGLRAGAACEDPSFGSGVCDTYQAQLFCAPPNQCEELGDGATCDSFGGPGICSEGACVSASAGGIDGLGVDACGNVYASEYIYGNIYRISPAGELERIAQLPSSWVPNIKWGRGVGGFSRDVMYVADRDEARLFAISVGLPGATELYDQVR
jgi:sugar lactone lactonase YvrE